MIRSTSLIGSMRARRATLMFTFAVVAVMVALSFVGLTARPAHAATCGSGLEEIGTTTFAGSPARFIQLSDCSDSARLKEVGPRDYVANVNGQPVSVTLAPSEVILLTFGGAGDDYIAAHPSVTSTIAFFGGTGDDYLVGGSGLGVPGRSILFGQEGDDLLVAGKGEVLMQAGPGDDALYGGPSGATMFAEAGDDLLVAGSGPASLQPGTGSDKIIMKASDTLNFPPDDDPTDDLVIVK
jgi:Ca2+-binding RTX toxin-like protein